MKIFSSLREKLAKHKIIAAIVVIALIAGIGVGAFYGWQQYQYHQTSEYALERLKNSLQGQNAHDLALQIDFQSISNDMVNAAYQNFPFLRERQDADRFVSHGAQKALLQKFMGEQKNSQFPEDQSEAALLKKPLALLPDDFVEQLVKKTTVRNLGPGRAELLVNISNPQLKEEIPLVLAMDRGPNGWVVKHLANADAAAAKLREMLLTRYAALRNVYLDKNAATTKEMNAIIPLTGCAANAGMLSDRKTFVMVVRVVAQNRGDVQVNNVNLDTVITGKSGQVLLRRFLNDAQPVAPGETFDHSWSVELDGQSKEAQALLHDGPLHCQGKWQTLSLNNGKVLHIDEVPNPVEACMKSGHNHPKAFCELPLFRR